MVIETLFTDLSYQAVFLAVACFCVVGILMGTVLIAGVLQSLRKYVGFADDDKFRFLYYGTILLEASFIAAFLNASAPPLPTGINYVPSMQTATLAFEISAYIIIFTAITGYLKQYEVDLTDGS